MVIIWWLLYRVATADAISMDELYRSILSDGQNEADLGFNVNYNRQDYKFDASYGTGRQTERSFDWYVVRPAFEAALARGFKDVCQVKLDVGYTMPSRYRFGYVEEDTLVARNNYNWREDMVNIDDPFTVNGEIIFRPAPQVDFTVNYNLDIYSLYTQSRSGNELSTIQYDLRERSTSCSQRADFTLTWLNDPIEKHPYIKSDIDGVLHPLLEKDQVKFIAGYSLECEELGFRDYKITNPSRSEERQNRNIFYGEVGVGTPYTTELDAFCRYYLPFDYLLKISDSGGLNTTQDSTAKYFGVYDVGGTLKKRVGENYEFLLSGEFTTTSNYTSNNIYSDSNGRSTAARYPYSSTSRRDIYSLRVGETYISDSHSRINKKPVTFDSLDRPLLEKGQFLMGGFFDYTHRYRRYRNGDTGLPMHFALSRNEYALSSEFSYGITGALELASLVAYTFPSVSKYDYMLNFTNKPSVSYSDEPQEQLKIDLALKFRPDKTTDITISAGYEPTALFLYQYNRPVENFNSTLRITDTNYTAPTQSETRNFNYDHYYAKIKLRKIF